MLDRLKLFILGEIPIRGSLAWSVPLFTIHSLMLIKMISNLSATVKQGGDILENEKLVSKMSVTMKTSLVVTSTFFQHFRHQQNYFVFHWWQHKYNLVGFVSRL